ncbi:uncharacterized protein PG998_000117 [Apiospora kogelbergensis]|uniref:uncharacterized protein n=1 Tax=Apiospora kogelbergensis TaxID=1337665 RepID=UPI0031328D6F
MEVNHDTRPSPAKEVEGHCMDNMPSPTSSRTSNMSFSRSDITLADPDPSPIPERTKTSRRLLRLPTLSRFLADFTLGFADGLTVPFALTAGLSSLGKTQTVIYAGMAEICAGSISMGIGGYLAAKGEQQQSSDVDDDEGDDAEKEAALSRTSADDVLEDYLAPLRLRGDLRAVVEAHLRRQPDLVDALRIRTQNDDDDSSSGFGTRAASPVLVGLSVVDGLRWSFGVCILALFVFGFTKHYLLQDGAQRHCRRPRKTAQWRRVRASLWEGAQMVVLGSIAAVTAVLAVKALEGMASGE